MTTDEHRDWRLSLGAYALGDLPPDERAAMSAHIEGCPECRAELRELEGVAALLTLADPARIEQYGAAIGQARKMRSQLLDLDTLRTWETNPMSYAGSPGGAFSFQGGASAHAQRIDIAKP